MSVSHPRINIMLILVDFRVGSWLAWIFVSILGTDGIIKSAAPHLCWAVCIIFAADKAVVLVELTCAQHDARGYISLAKEL